METSQKQIGEEIYLTEVEARTAIKSLKAGIALGKDEILKAVNNFGVRWLTRVFQVAWKTGEVPKHCADSYLFIKKDNTYYNTYS